MYKRITHNIIEEHFDHPMAGQIKSNLDKASKKSRLGRFGPVGIPTNETFDRQIYQTDLVNYFVNYASKLNELIDSVVGNEANTITAFESIFQGIDTFGNMTKPFFSSEFGEHLNAMTRSIPIYTIGIVHQMRTGQETAGFETRLSNIADELANTIINFMEIYSPTTLANDLQQIMTNISNRMKAKYKNNTAVEQQLGTQILNDFTQFAGRLTNGIVNKFPERFTSAQLPFPPQSPMNIASCPPTPAPTPSGIM